MKFNLKTASVMFLIAFFTIWIFVNIYFDAKPKTSVDLVDELSVGKRDSLILDDGEVTKEQLDEYTPIFEGNIDRVNQYTVIESGDEYLLLETTPGLNDQQLKIKQIKTLPKDVFENLQ